MKCGNSAINFYASTLKNTVYRKLKKIDYDKK